MMNNNNNSQGFIPKHGGYRNLLSYQKAEIIYDGTVYFTNRFYRKPDRTIDQMVQAARSGKQNIVEGSMASATSKETEIKLMNVAKASLEELMLDYEDFLRTRKLTIWEKESPKITTYLLAKLIQSLEKDFLENGGLRERMTKARIESRNKNK
jgi:four helix bundle suffix protein